MLTMANSSYSNNRKCISDSTALPLCPSNLYAAKCYYGQADKTNFQVLATKKSKCMHCKLEIFLFFPVYTVIVTSLYILFYQNICSSYNCCNISQFTWPCKKNCFTHFCVYLI
jgi:hypothetical protein